MSTYIAWRYGCIIRNCENIRKLLSPGSSNLSTYLYFLFLYFEEQVKKEMLVSSNLSSLRPAVQNNPGTTVQDSAVHDEGIPHSDKS